MDNTDMDGNLVPVGITAASALISVVRADYTHGYFLVLSEGELISPW